MRQIFEYTEGPSFESYKRGMIVNQTGRVPSFQSSSAGLGRKC
jgi:hypothetical protein